MYTKGLTTFVYIYMFKNGISRSIIIMIIRKTELFTVKVGHDRDP